MSDGKPGRKELAEAVEKLTAEVAALRAERAAHTCHSFCSGHAHCNWGHCGCFTIHTVMGATPYQLPQVWCGTVTSGTNVCVTDATSVAAGVGTTYSLALGN